MKKLSDGKFLEKHLFKDMKCTRFKKTEVIFFMQNMLHPISSELLLKDKFKESVFRIIMHILFYLFFAFSYLAAESYSSIEDRATTKILTPALANQKTAKIRLENGLEALLISAPKANQSGALMSVNAGSWEDPEEYPGLAHFL